MKKIKTKIQPGRSRKGYSHHWGKKPKQQQHIFSTFSNHLKNSKECSLPLASALKCSTTLQEHTYLLDVTNI